MSTEGSEDASEVDSAEEDIGSQKNKKKFRCVAISTILNLNIKNTWSLNDGYVYISRENFVFTHFMFLQAWNSVVGFVVTILVLVSCMFYSATNEEWRVVGKHFLWFGSAGVLGVLVSNYLYHEVGWFMKKTIVERPKSN